MAKSFVSLYFQAIPWKQTILRMYTLHKQSIIVFKTIFQGNGQIWHSVLLFQELYFLKIVLRLLSE